VAPCAALVQTSKNRDGGHEAAAVPPERRAARVRPVGSSNAPAVATPPITPAAPRLAGMQAADAVHPSTRPAVI